MATELRWPREATFVERSHQGDDGEERRYVGPGVYEVPESMVEAYLERGWERPDEGGEDAPAAAEQDTESEESDDEPEDEAEGFDPEEFVGDSWQAVTAAIEDGEADGHLDAVEAAERDREGDPRDSVLGAIEERG